MEIYAMKISDISEKRLNKLNSLIDLEKKYKIEKFINKKDRIRTLMGEIIIRTVIIERLNIDNTYIKFSKNKYGKPCLSEWQNFNFNISHSGDCVVCAIDNKSIGIDVEEIRQFENYKKIAKNFFASNELDYIFKQDLKSNIERFYEIWTLKESYIKCCGLGLSIPLNSFTIEVHKNKGINVIRENKHTGYNLKLFDIDWGYKVAICSLNKNIPNKIKILDQDSLIDKYISSILIN